jgi:hypothetical protein
VLDRRVPIIVKKMEFLSPLGANGGGIFAYYVVSDTRSLKAFILNP